MYCFVLLCFHLFYLVLSKLFDLRFVSHINLGEFLSHFFKYFFCIFLSFPLCICYTFCICPTVIGYPILFFFIIFYLLFCFLSLYWHILKVEILSSAMLSDCTNEPVEVIFHFHSSVFNLQNSFLIHIKMSISLLASVISCCLLYPVEPLVYLS